MKVLEREGRNCDHVDVPTVMFSQKELFWSSRATLNLVFLGHYSLWFCYTDLWLCTRAARNNVQLDDIIDKYKLSGVHGKFSFSWCQSHSINAHYSPNKVQNYIMVIG